MLTQEDKVLLGKKGITEQQMQEELAYFESGFPYLKLEAAASIERGILVPEEKAVEEYLNAWNTYKQADKKIMKFVPASGAASRMFKNMFAFMDADYNDPHTDFEKDFFAHIHCFAFYEDLNKVCIKNEGKDVDTLISEKNYKAVVADMLQEKGLNYGNLPKGLLKFHNYEKGSRTAMEEHLVEGALYTAGTNREVNIHFTVSSEHVKLFTELVKEKAPIYAAMFDVNYNISFSIQKPSTDTIAVDMENKPFRVDGKLFFRPGGHGSLIENLNDLDADIVFIKNVDNVVPDKLKDDTVKYKNLIAGVLVSYQQKAFKYLNILETGKYTHDLLAEMAHFLQHDLCCRKPDIKTLEDTELAIYLYKKLNRPMRVCGMVKNVGEPGGGPFLAYNPDGTISLQILESSQIEMNDVEKKSMFQKGTHFNPVDLVCGIKDYKGNAFNLLQYVDKSTGFISQKSKDGRDLKALEHPGLWNGSMSDWNTIFVEVPLNTFNPVKTVNDLLHPQHQG
ncbi:DUF4301 family protein [Phocaeicola oris]|uniref:DUF4301 family protein n=1 Tax=Phocaeicola oris TaxID=2896850 RepID=UPI00234F8FC0|nr:DUF4301 family protein [Phocaeicola oris]MCE2615386.1 DUF4301 family protein [Phocaeicola oris]